VISSTVLPATCMSLGDQAKAVGLSVVDAPVSGGAEKALQGIITVLVGGEDAAVETCWPVSELVWKGSVSSWTDRSRERRQADHQLC